ncbi:MAG TPA: hypothetical protein DEO84_09095 [candidate division Zixibacteria bacterium]|nr:hypothetical protein [candidate division Zixibacteria bacterium]
MWNQRGASFVNKLINTLIVFSIFIPGSAIAATSLSSVTLAPTSVVGGARSTGTVVLSGMAPWGGISVSLTSSNPSTAVVPGSVKVNFWQKSAKFTITTSPVSVSKVVSITAFYQGITKTTPLTVNPTSASPLITSHPVNKTVTEGQTATFTVAATGSGLSYQWQRLNNGGSTWTNIGTNSASYTTAATVIWDNGAQFRCLVTNSAGSATSNTATLTVNPTVSMIAVTDFANYRVFQREIGGTSKSVTITGTYSNLNWHHIDARLLTHGTNTTVVDWTTIDSTPGGGTFSGILSVPQGGWYNIEIRAVDNSGSTIGSSRGTKKWGVGMIILCIGQSNMSGHGQNPFTIATSDLAVNYSNAGVWEHLSDPYDDGSPAGAVDNDNSTAAGSMIPALANSLLQTINFPIAFVPSPKDNSNLYSQWAYRNSSNHYDTTTLYGQSITKARNVGGVELIVMYQGEADTNAHRTEAQYKADFATLIGNYRQDLYANIPIFICQLGPITLGFNTRTDADVVAVRSAQHDLDNGEDIFMAATAMDQPRLDHVHFTTQGLDAIGGRIAQTINYYLGAASYYRGPAIITPAFFTNGNRDTVDIQIGHRGENDITPDSGITGFSLLSNGSPVSITSAVRMSADRIRLTLGSAIPPGTTVKLRYLWGSNPDTSALVKDNSSLELPLENTTADITIIDQQLP